MRAVRCTDTMSGGGIGNPLLFLSAEDEPNLRLGTPREEADLGVDRTDLEHVECASALSAPFRSLRGRAWRS